MEKEISFAHDRIDTLVLGRKFVSPDTQKFVLEHYRGARFRDALRIELAVGEAWLFDYGPLVLWGVSEEDKQRLRNQLQDYVDTPADRPDMESFQFIVNAPELRIHEDKLSLPSNRALVRLAASHALAQSVKLGVFETIAQDVIQSNEYIPRALAKNGRIPLARRALTKLRGALFSTRSDIVLNFNLLDTPEFFWDYPELEPTYGLVARYLDIVPRTTLLNKKLETIHELLEMLASERNHQHAAFLEWIIIALIAVDIVVYFLH